ncbi:MAG: NAD-dependent epimerase/dehydratase family protein [Candidatus Shapirobacteria bacterium]|jgi:NADH dehydrogenase
MVKKIFITGANGFIGHNLVNYLSGRGYEVYALIRKSTVPCFDLKENVRVIRGDLLDKESLEKNVPQGSVVINLGANPYDPKLSYLVNVGGTRDLIDVCKRKRVKKFIHTSSQSTKIRTKGVYADSKLKCDDMIKESGVNFVILRPSLVYGGGEKGLFNKIKTLVSKAPFIPVFGDGKCKICPIYIDDFCRVVECLIEDSNLKNEVFDVGSRKAITYGEMYEKTIARINGKAKILHIPVTVGIFFGRVFELAKLKNPPFFIDNVIGSTQESFCDARKILDRYRIEPISFDQGLTKALGGNKVNLAVVGLGKMGLMHMSILSTFRDAEIVALVDNNQKLYKVIKSMGVSGRFYQNLEDALRNEKIDGVFILTPTLSHYELVKTAYKYGKSVFVEKPLCFDYGQLKELRKFEKGNEVVTNVGYTLLFKRINRKIRSIIEDNTYGKVVGFDAKFEYGEVLGPKKGWMFSKKMAGGGVLINSGPHILALVNYLFGKPEGIKESAIRKIYSTEVDDEAKMKLKYKNFMGDVFISWSVKGVNIPRTIIDIKFEKGQLWSDGSIIKITTQEKKEVLIQESAIAPLYQNIFNINPDVSGEAYGLEDRLFIENVKSKNLKGDNNLSFALDTEEIIFTCYLKSNAGNGN